MECDRCKSAEAILHITQAETDMLAQRHLCRVCAEAEGHHPPPPREPTDWTILDTLNDEVASPIRRSVHSRGGIPRVKLEIPELLAPSVNAS